MSLAYQGFSDHDQETLHKALVRMKLLTPDAPLPEPYALIGMTQPHHPRIYLLSPKAGADVIVARFDRPERIEREWETLARLRTMETAPDAMLPLPENTPEDHVIVYRDRAPGKITDLGTMLEGRLLDDPDDCLRALSDALGVLNRFFQARPGGASLSRKMQRWRDVFPMLDGPFLRKHIFDGVMKFWPPEDTDSTFPDPLSGLDTFLNELTGTAMFSRVHGNLNLSNILVGMDGEAHPSRMLLIDLAECSERKPTALDFARLESDFWHETLPVIAQNESVARRTLRVIRDCLDGRENKLSSLCSSFEVNVLRFVGLLRRAAINTLRGDKPNYLLKDYVISLYFQHLNAMSYDSVRGSRLKSELALMGASMAMHFLEDWEAGRYDGEDMLHPLFSPLRSYEEMFDETVSKTPWTPSQGSDWDIKSQDPLLVWREKMIALDSNNPPPKPKF